MDYNILLHSQVDSPLQQLSDPLFEHFGLSVYIKRDDLIHPQISGNKWRKLKHNLIGAHQDNINQIVTFGGAYSNHIHALSYAGKEFNFDTVGIIRGEYDPTNPTLRQAKNAGMQLEFITRSDYKKRNEPAFLKQIQQQYPLARIIPEGGSNEAALLGMEELVTEIPRLKADYIVCPCGSGGTTAGLLKSTNSTQEVTSIAVLKNADYLKDEIQNLAGFSSERLNFKTQYHHGGYGKVTPELITFIQTFYHQFKIALEPIYSGKMMFAFYDLVKKGHFKQGSSITLIHTGGLQGLNGLKQRGIVPDNIFNSIS